MFADGEQVGFARESPRVCLKRTALCLEGMGLEGGGTCTLLIVLSWSVSSGDQESGSFASSAPATPYKAERVQYFSPAVIESSLIEFLTSPSFFFFVRFVRRRT